MTKMWNNNERIILPLHKSCCLTVYRREDDEVDVQTLSLIFLFVTRIGKLSEHLLLSRPGQRVDYVKECSTGGFVAVPSVKPVCIFIRMAHKARSQAIEAWQTIIDNGTCAGRIPGGRREAGVCPTCRTTSRRLWWCKELLHRLGVKKHPKCGCHWLRECLC